MKNRKKWIVLILLVLFTIWMVITNVIVELNTVELTYKDLPDAFDGYRIVQISDLHNSKIACNSDGLLEDIKAASPDIIAITGDLVDSNTTDIELALSFVKKLTGVAPCYYVTGNHESWLSHEDYLLLEQGLMECGVTILRDKEVLLEKNGEQISLVGIDDPDYPLSNGVGKSMLPGQISELSAAYTFNILLAHRPEYYETYKKTDVNLVLAGHAHGGQFRLPFIGGLVAPNQGMFPEYDSGVYAEEEFAMVVSRGIGNSFIPIRFNNQPEVVVIELIRQ